MDLSTLVPLVEQCIYHSHLASKLSISGIGVNVPIRGFREYLLKIERHVYADYGVSAHNEQSSAATILSRELGYILDSATEYGEPVYQDNESGDTTQIGNAVVVIDRERLSAPMVAVGSDGALYLDCVDRVSK